MLTLEIRITVPKIEELWIEPPDEGDYDDKTSKSTYYISIMTTSIAIYYAGIECPESAAHVPEKLLRKKSRQPTTSHIWEEAAARPILINVGTLGDLDDIINFASFGSDRFHGFLPEGPKLAISYTSEVLPSTQCTAKPRLHVIFDSFCAALSCPCVGKSKCRVSSSSSSSSAGSTVLLRTDRRHDLSPNAPVCCGYISASFIVSPSQP
jgi:hypothetical protein